MGRYTTLREFRTKSFLVVLDWTYDDDYELDVKDDNGEPCAETAAKLASGEWSAYGFRVRVLAQGKQWGYASIWGSIYADPAEFMDHRRCGEATRRLRAEGQYGVVGSYFADMVREAIQDARMSFKDLRKINVRTLKLAA